MPERFVVAFSDYAWRLMCKDCPKHLDGSFQTVAAASPFFFGGGMSPKDTRRFAQEAVTHTLEAHNG